jgi:hypothetical protein
MLDMDVQIFQPNLSTTLQRKNRNTSKISKTDFRIKNPAQGNQLMQFISLCALHFLSGAQYTTALIEIYATQQRVGS